MQSRMLEGAVRLVKIHSSDFNRSTHFYNKQWRKAVRNKLRQKFDSFMQKKYLYTS